MSDTFTSNLNMTKPAIGGSVDSWGTKWNSNLDTLDTIFNATGTAVNMRFASANFDDNAKAIFGTSDDLEIFFDGLNSEIKDNGQGNLNLRTNGASINLLHGSESMLLAQANGGVSIYHDDSKKLETTSSGVSVTGDIAVTGNVDGVDVSGLSTTVSNLSSSLSTVATSGSYNDLSNRPTIPTNNNQLSNGAGYTTYSANQSLNTTNSPTFAQIYANDWFRANGNTGIYWQTHGRGWQMSDSSWIRTYGAVGLYVTNGQILATSNITAYYSDERLKDKVGKIENALDKVSQIETFYFKENKLAKSFGHDIDKVQVGVSAQSVKKVLPEIVDLAPFDMNDEMNGSKSGEDYMTVDYAKLTPLLIEAIKELKDEIKELKGV
tara:strand:+ start:3791 stop:4927 length:1137 start_codon:yes stop_codon:yes gene_type:complete